MAAEVAVPHEAIAVRAIDQLPARPSMPTIADQTRAVMLGDRFDIMNELFDDVLEEWMEEHVDVERLTAWGPPDTSVNPLADICRQFTVPGLYGRRPSVMHQDPAAMELVGPGGLLDKAGLFTKLQQVQYFSCGLGDYLVRIDAIKDLGRLSYRLVAPHNVYAVSDDNLPDVAIELWELRLRFWKDRDEWVWTWDQFRISDDSIGGEPSFRSVRATSDPVGDPGEDLSEVFLGGTFEGDDYPFRDSENKPFIPYSWYRSQDAGLLWNSNAKRGATRGALNSALNWTYAGHAARDASGQTIFAVGVEEPAVTTRRKGRDNEQSNNAVRTLMLTPGALVVLRPSSDGNGQVTFFQAGPGANLPEVAEYASLYEQKQAVRSGVNPSDIIRMGGSPMSGAAMFISTKGRRENARQVEPLFRQSDLATISMSASLANGQGIASGLPEGGYTITYAEIPESPAEQKERRDDIQWQTDNRYLSPITAYQQLHPGASREDALAAMVQAELDRRLLIKMANEEAAAQGLPDADRTAEATALRTGATRAPVGTLAQVRGQPDEGEPAESTE